MSETDAGKRHASIPPDGRAEAWEELSPDGRVLVRWTLDHGLGNIEYRVPAIHDAATGALLFDLGGRFDGSVRWLEGGRFELHLGRWYGGGRAEFLVDPERGAFRVLARPEEGESEDGPEQPLAFLPEQAEREMERGREEAERLHAEQQRKFRRWLFWRHELPRIGLTAVAILALLGAIAAGSYWWHGGR
jgi:hypothetical protein